MKDLISIGDATLDTFIALEEASVSCNINKEDCQLCLNYGDKIPIKSVIKKVAGNAANVAVGGARLGLKTAFWTVLGDDLFSDTVIKTMKKEGVSTEYVKKQKNSESNFTVVLNYKGERTQLVHALPRNYIFPKKLESSQFIYLTAMGENHHMAYAELLKYLLKTKTKLAYNPGRFQITCKEKICDDLLPYTDILFVNKEEARMVLGIKKSKNKNSVKEIKLLLKGLVHLGPRIAVITDGANGSYAYADNVAYYLPIFKGPLVERTGAGDSYATGFLAAIMNGKTTSEAMVWGTFNSWSVVQFIGPHDGLLKKNKMLDLVKKNKKFIPKEI